MITGNCGLIERNFYCTDLCEKFNTLRKEGQLTTWTALSEHISPSAGQEIPPILRNPKNVITAFTTVRH